MPFPSFDSLALAVILFAAIRTLGMRLRLARARKSTAAAAAPRPAKA